MGAILVVSFGGGLNPGSLSAYPRSVVWGVETFNLNPLHPFCPLDCRYRRHPAQAEVPHALERPTCRSGLGG